MAASDDIEARFAKASVLTEQGRTDEARATYLELLALAPDHAGALNNLGTLLFETGYRAAARTAYAEAVARHPGDPVGQVNLGNLLLAAGEAEAARAHFEAALRLVPDHAEAHRGMAYCLDEAGDAARARSHRDAAFTGRAVTRLPYRGEGTGVPVLMLVAAAGGNIPTRFLLDDRTFATTVVVADYFQGEPPPGHRLIFNAIGDADLAGEALSAAARIVAEARLPAINPPERAAAPGRAEVARRLAGIPGLVVPRLEMLPRDSVTAAELARRGYSFPLLLRAPGFHTGKHFVRVGAAEELSGALAALPGATITAIELLDARSLDGLWRKYRAMTVDGHLYPLHLAVSQQWKVHYFTAAMADHAEHRAEERAFLSDMPRLLGPRAMAALARVDETLGLDYGGIDFGLGLDGSVLLFEANATMVVNPPEPDPRWDYRRAPVQTVLDAVRRMLLARARPG